MNKLFLFLISLVMLLPQSVYARGRIQDSDVKSLTEVGSTKSRLINDTKIYVTGGGINDQLSTAITNNLISGNFENRSVNGNAELGTTGWTANGGTSAVASETSIIRSGLKAIKFTSSGATDYLLAQAVTLLPGSNSCNITFYYQSASAAFSAKIYFGATLISTTALPASSTYTPVTIPFSCSDVSSQYSMRVDGGAAADIAYIDDYYIGKTNVAYGAVVTAKQSLAVTSSWTTNTTTTAFYRQVGDSADIEIMTKCTGNPDNVDLTYTLPFNFDTTKMVSGTTLGGDDSRNEVSIYIAGWGMASGLIELSGTNTITVRVSKGDSTYVYPTTANKTTPSTFVNGSYVNVKIYSLPIVGLNATAILGQDAAMVSTSEIMSRITSTQTLTKDGFREVVFNNAIADTVAGADVATGRVTAKFSGYHNISYALDVTMGATAPTDIQPVVLIGGTGTYYAQYYTNSLANSKRYTFNGTDRVWLNQGQYVSVWVWASGQDVTLNIGSRFSVSREAGPAGFVALQLPTTIQTFTSGSGTYTKPAGIKYIKVKMVGGGGGGGGSGTGTPPSGGNGGNTTFGSSLLTANGGGGGVALTAGTGGTATISAPATGIALQGAAGGVGSAINVSSAIYMPGGYGGVSPFGGAGANGWGAGIAAKANTGSGGGGGNLAVGNAAQDMGSGGDAGGYIEAIIANPAATYAYAVGAAGSAGSAGTSGNAGGAGGSGVIIVEEFYY